MRSLEEPDRDRRLGEGRELVLDGDRVSVWAGERVLERRCKGLPTNVLNATKLCL